MLIEGRLKSKRSKNDFFFFEYLLLYCFAPVFFQIFGVSMLARSFWCKKVRFLAFASKSRFFGFFVVHSVGLDSKPRKVQFHGKILPWVLYLPRLRPVGAQKGFGWRSRAKTGTFSGVVHTILNYKPTKTMATVSRKSNAVSKNFYGGGTWNEGNGFCKFVYLDWLLAVTVDLNFTITNLLQILCNLLDKLGRFCDV